MNKNILVIASLLGALAVILGALGAHALKDMLGTDGIKNFETAVKYQMFHVFAIFIVQMLPPINVNTKKWISVFFLIGILFFSGSLYVITTGIISAKYIWFITPLGGLSFIIGWLLLTWSFIKSNSY